MPSEGMRGCKVPLMAEDKGICGDNYVKQEQPQYPPHLPIFMSLQGHTVAMNVTFTEWAFLCVFMREASLCHGHPDLENLAPFLTAYQIQKTGQISLHIFLSI